MMMRAMVAAVFLAGAAFASEAPEAAPETAPVTVTKARFCTAVADREPVDGKDSPAEFEANVDRVYFWNDLKVEAPPQVIKHVWYSNGEKTGEVELTLKYKRNRTWSSKKIWKGAWKVELTADGAVVSTHEFTIR